VNINPNDSVLYRDRYVIQIDRIEWCSCVVWCRCEYEK